MLAKKEHDHVLHLKPRPDHGIDCLTCAMLAKREHVHDFHLKLGPDSGLDCLICAMLARLRSSVVKVRHFPPLHPVTQVLFCIEVSFQVVASWLGCGPWGRRCCSQDPPRAAPPASPRRYMGTSPINSYLLLGPYSRSMPGALRWSYGHSVSYEQNTPVRMRGCRK